MDIKKLFSNKKQIMKHTFSMRFRFLATVIFAMLAITICIGGISIYEVDNYIQDQSENYVNVICENEVSQINDSLGNMEKSAKIMESYLMDFFTSKEDIENPELQEKVIESATQMFTDIAKHTSTNGAISYYFRFNPEISNSKAGLFYSKTNETNEFVAFEPTDISLYEKDDTEHVGWFWQPYEAKKPIWMKPYHNQNNDILMISYVIPMYFEEKFIGVVGMDFDYMFLADQVHAIEIYENGFAHLEIDGEIICSDEHKTEINNTSKQYLRVSNELLNGMTLVLSASYDDIREIRYNISIKIIFIVIILSALFMIIAVVVVKKIVDPLKNLTDASIKLSNGDYAVDIANSNTYEIKLLSSAFKNMAICLREREELLQLSANRDSLTELRNVTSYKSWVVEFSKKIENNNANFGIVVLDINYLKETNDNYGHAIGDKLIVASSEIISDIFKKSPVFRIGGDEFLVVLQNSDLENREILFEKFDSRCADTFIKANKSKIPVSIAKGYALYDSTKDSTFKDVFNRADTAMYENKRKMKDISL